VLAEKYVFNKDHKIANSALISLAVEIMNNVFLKEKFNLKSIINEKLKNLNRKDLAADILIDEKITIIKVIAIAKMHKYLDNLTDFFKDDSTAVVNAAILSSNYLLLPDFIPLIIDKLENPATSKSAIFTLIRYGESALEKIEKKLLHQSTGKQTKLNIVEILGGIGSKVSVNILFDALEREDYNLQKDILKSLNNLKQNHSQLKFDWNRVLKKLYKEIKLELEIITTIYLQTKIEMIEANNNRTDNALIIARKNLITILESRLDVGLERIFRLLGLKYPPQDMIKIYNSIHSSKEEMRENAVDFLDNLLEMNLKKMILPLVELKISEKVSSDILKQYKLKVPDEVDCFQDLLQSKDNKLVLATIKVIILSDMNQLFPKIESIKMSNPELEPVINKILNELKK
jgi:AAA family ATP:ADP antiporter